MRARSITLQLTLLFAASTTLVLLTVGTVLGVLIDEHFEAEDLAELEAKIRVVEDARPAAGPTNATPGIELPAALLSAVPRATDGLGTSAPIVWDSGGHRYRGILRRTAHPAGGSTVVVAALDISHHAAFMSAMRRALSAAILVGIALSIPLGWFAARRGMAPLRVIARLAGKMSAARLGERIPPGQVPVELEPLAASLNDMLSRLEDSFRRLSDFSSDLAHELRTPITNVLTQTQVTLSRARAAEEYREILHSNLEEFERLARMTEDMLFLARSDRGLTLPERASVDLAAEADDLRDFYDALASESGVRLERKGSGTANGDRLMLRRALSNLLSNAIRHAHPGTVVGIDVSTDAGRVMVAVENSGEEIDARHLPRIFDRFYRVDRARASSGGGWGLGLAIARAIATAHGGDIAVTSAGGRTRFILSLPR